VLVAVLHAVLLVSQRRRQAAGLVRGDRRPHVRLPPPTPKALSQKLGDFCVNELAKTGQEYQKEAELYDVSFPDRPGILHGFPLCFMRCLRLASGPLWGVGHDVARGLW
jgi:hypothetical protein